MLLASSVVLQATTFVALPIFSTPSTPLLSSASWSLPGSFWHVGVEIFEFTSFFLERSLQLLSICVLLVFAFHQCRPSTPLFSCLLTSAVCAVWFQLASDVDGFTGAQAKMENSIKSQLLAAGVLGCCGMSLAFAVTACASYDSSLASWSNNCKRLFKNSSGSETAPLLG